MRRICLLFSGLLWLACSSGPRISTVSNPVTVSKGLKPAGLLDLSQLGQRGLKGPSAIAVDPSGNVYIADTNNDRILKFSPTGVLLKSQGGFGWDGGQFNRPTGLGLDRGLNLYVADSQNKRAQLFDLNLNFVSAIQPPETLDFHGLGATYDVAVSSSGELYISDTWNDWILQTDNFYAFKGKIGSFEAGEGRLTDPLGLATDSRGNLYSADSGNKRIAVFDPFGNFQRSLGEGLLSKPSDVAAAGGEIMVCDQELSQVFCFDQQGKLVWQSGSKGDQIGQFREPSSLAVYENRLYVVEKGNNRVQIFEIVR
jgi:tripartite motif-containing protein 71